MFDFMIFKFCFVLDVFDNGCGLFVFFEVFCFEVGVGEMFDFI